DLPALPSFPTRRSSDLDHAARRLAGDGRLVGDPVEEERLDELRLREGRCDLDQRLAREHDTSLGHRPHVAREAKSLERLEVLSRSEEHTSELQSRENLV